ncbi:MAG: hypothetical protein JWP97_1790 [Labilithrix sp.]|nr:hypothetical protein [Labilithrix sp.]
MRKKFSVSLFVVAALAIGGVAVADDSRHQVPTSKDGNVVVGLCDGTTSSEVKGVKPGQALTAQQARDVSDDLMNQWKKKNPGLGASWDQETKLVAQNKVPAPNPQAAPAPAGTTLPAPGAKLQEGHTYGAFTTRDEQLWRASTQAFVDKGNAIFHDAKAMGGTIAVSCDMCHPNAANTHPETYPKYQVQLGKVAMLRDMINWCIENPVRGKPLADDDPRLKAMEAYIYAQRKGVALEYGKH